MALVNSQVSLLDVLLFGGMLWTLSVEIEQTHFAIGSPQLLFHCAFLAMLGDYH